MSKLAELIAELCPDGVEFIRMADLYSIKGRVGWQRLTKSEYRTSGDYYLITGTDFTANNTIDYSHCYYVDKKRYEQDENIQIHNGDIILTKDGTIGKVAIVEGMDKPATLNSHLLLFRDQTGRVINSYLKHVLLSKIFTSFVAKNATKGTIIGLPQKTIAEFRVPVPPLEVQHEIVRVLDNFTSLLASLSAELSARRKQYEYYRDQTLRQNEDECKIAKLSEIAEIYDGTHQTPEYMPEGIPFISVENIGNIYSSSKYISKEAFTAYKIKPQVGDLFMTRIGTIGKCAVMTKPEALAYYVSLALIRPNQRVLDVRYLKHYIESTQGGKELSKRTLHNAVPIKINKDDIGKIIIRYPSLELQTRIADVLDNFDTICSDLNIGLPAEIEARQKQYEYYRNKLLTFDDCY